MYILQVKRQVAYDETKKELDKWDPIVEKNRKAETQEFPLEKPDLRLITADKFVKRFTVRRSRLRRATRIQEHDLY